MTFRIIDSDIWQWGCFVLPLRNFVEIQGEFILSGYHISTIGISFFLKSNHLVKKINPHTSILYFSNFFFFYLKVQSFRLIMENNFIQMAASAGHAVAKNFRWRTVYIKNSYNFLVELNCTIVPINEKKNIISCSQ